MSKYKICFSAKNVGPHQSLQAEIEINKPRLLLYAGNGSGKTFLSRMFRLSSKPTPSNDFLTFQAPSGSFSFSLRKYDEEGNLSEEVESGYSVSLKRNENSCSGSQSDILYRVFNSDYVSENLRSCSFSPDGDSIQGSIVGKGNIDVTELEKSVQIKKDEKDSHFQEIEKALNATKESLQQLGIRGNLQAYQALTIDRLLSAEATPNNAYDETISKLIAIKNVPGNMDDLAIPSFDYSQFDSARINSLLNTSFSRSTFQTDFCNRVQQNQVFIQEGVSIYKQDSSECPFCRQQLSQSAKQLIESYEEYLEDSEAKAHQSLTAAKRSIKALNASYDKWLHLAIAEIAKFQNLQKALPSLSDICLTDPPSSTEFYACAQSLLDLLDEKTKDITTPLQNKCATDFVTLLNSIDSFISETRPYLAKANKAKGKINAEQKALRETLCGESLNKMAYDSRDAIERYRTSQTEEAAASAELQAARDTERTPKRRLVADTFEEVISQFFGKKYAFNKESFVLSCEDNQIGGKADKVLSEGEQTIVAFCYYLASISLIIDTDEDWKRLILVIDDPVSSLDFQYVYAVAQTLKPETLKQYTHGEIRPYILLTHNVEFYNILGRNNTVKDRVVLAGGEIVKSSKTDMLPYEEHLCEILDVATQRKVSSFRTPNSIRHVLECAWRTHSPDKDCLISFLETQSEYKSNRVLYAICEDLSHGAQRLEPPCTEEEMRRACDATIEVVRDLFPGQIAYIIKSRYPSSDEVKQYMSER